MYLSHPPLYGRAAVATSQPLATTAGLRTLLRGGNAADAAIAIAAALAVTEPCSNGPGGDAFALVYTASNSRITAVHGNGAAPMNLRPALFSRVPGRASPHTITVPGAVALWVDLVKRYGSGEVSLREVLEPAIELAERGFVVGEVTARLWKLGEELLRNGMGGDTLLKMEGGELRAPKAGEVFRNEELGNVLRRIATEGKDGFYKGETATAIVAVVRALGGVLTLEDLEAHCTEFREPIKTEFREYTVYEPGPPAHGIVALVALAVLNGFDTEMSEEDATHVMVEAVRMAYEKASKCVADSRIHGEERVLELLGQDVVEEMRKRIDLGKKGSIDWGGQIAGGGTVQFCVVDGEGNAVSMVQSNYMGFGTGHVPKGTGFSLHNRGLNFAHGVSGHANAPSGGKKPYHTIIPALLTKTESGELFAVLGLMGSFMQPQGHLQVIRGLVDCKLNSQQVLDRARFRVTGPFSGIEPGMGKDEILVEEEFDKEIVESLAKRGHVVGVGEREVFGRGQVIVVREGGVVEAGSDNRADGCSGVL